MKILNACFAILIVCMLAGCGMNDNTGKMEPVQIKTESVPCDAKLAKAENNYSVFAESANGKINILDTALDKELVSIKESYGSGSLYLYMTDNSNGYLLYCSSPACGLMTKLLYTTKDRWQTYDETDISSQIDGYPTSLSARSDDHLYVGAQLRSDGYLFETTDGGTSWNPVLINGEIEKCRNGYAPVLDNETGISYLLLECHGYYSLYQSDAMMSDWKLQGTFSLESELGSYFIIDNEVIIEDMRGQSFKIIKT